MPDRLQKQIEYLAIEHPDIDVLGNRVHVIDEKDEIVGAIALWILF